MSTPLAETDNRLEVAIRYHFQDRSLLQQALTHRSASDPGKSLLHNERLEFLGDAVLGLIAARRLFELFPDAPEGRLTKLKARLVSGASLEGAARRLEIGRALRIGRAEEASGGRDKKGILVDALEALIAAIYLDGGDQEASAFILREILPDLTIDEADANLEAGNPKSTLQEHLQSRGEPLPSYRVLSEAGPPHQRRFEVEIRLDGGLTATGTGSTKRQAEQNAAAALLQRLESAPAT